MWALVNRHLEQTCAPTLPLLNRGLFLGDGVFTTIRAEDGKLQFFQDHMERLEKDAAAFDLFFDSKGLYEVTYHLLEENQLLQGKARVRVTITRTYDHTGVRLSGQEMPLEIITANGYEPKAVALHMTISDLHRGPVGVLTETKHLGYQTAHLALHGAIKNDFDDAILLSLEGKIACATTANIYFMIDGQWITPPVADGALPGIIRNRLLHTHQVVEQSLYPHDLSKVSAAFVTNSLIGIKPIARINDQVFNILLPHFPQI